MPKPIYIGLTEEMVCNPDALHKKVRNWRMYRIEYGGFNEDCVWEGRILLPARADPGDIEKMLTKMQTN